MTTLAWKKGLLISVGLGVIIYVTTTLHYLVSEFAIHRNANVDTCSTCSMVYLNKIRDTRRIPNIIHQIYFSVTRATPSQELQTGRESWIRTHENYTHYLWNETAVLHLIRGKYPQLESRYRSYDYWVRRVNVARYLILYHYGGWYIDMDTTCTHSLNDLADTAFRLNKSVVQHYTFPVGTSNGFFGVTPRHQFLKSVLDYLPNSDRTFIFPYPNTVLTTGTTYMWGRYLNYPYKEEFLILEKNEISKYFVNQHASSWHGWDALVIRYVIHHIPVIVALTIILAACITAYKRFRINASKRS